MSIYTNKVKFLKGYPGSGMGFYDVGTSFFLIGIDGCNYCVQTKEQRDSEDKNNYYMIHPQVFNDCFVPVEFLD